MTCFWRDEIKCHCSEELSHIVTPSFLWVSSVRVSSDGTSVVVNSSPDNVSSYLYKSVDNLNTWNPIYAFNSVYFFFASKALSAVNVSHGSGRSFSSDFGVSWLERTWSGWGWLFLFDTIASSADGVKLFTGRSLGGGNKSLIVSTDSGASFSGLGITGKFHGFASDANGVNLFASGERTAGIYVSNSSGASYTQKTFGSVDFFNEIVCSDDGVYAAVCGEDDNLYLSSDYGYSFTPVALPKPYIRYVTMSSTGEYILACGDGNIVFSSDFGATFSTLTSLAGKAWVSPAISDALSKVFVVDSNTGELWGMGV